MFSYKGNNLNCIANGDCIIVTIQQLSKHCDNRSYVLNFVRF